MENLKKTAVTPNVSDLQSTESTMEIKVVYNVIFSIINKFDDSQINLVELFFLLFLK